MGALQNVVNLRMNAVVGQTLGEEWTIEAGKPQKLTGNVVLDPGNQRVFIANSVGFISNPNLLNLCMIIDELSYAETTYDNIVRQASFRKLYQLGLRTLNYVDGTAPATKNEDSFPCQECGLVLPLKLMSVDHTRPQVGGESEAVAKVLRVLNLTVAGPTGSKATQVQAAVSSALRHHQGLGPGLQVAMGEANFSAVPTKPGRPPKGPSTSSLVDRYSLDWKGATFYSVVRALNCLNVLETRCMHSLINLRPLCSHCNSTRGNPTKF